MQMTVTNECNSLVVMNDLERLALCCSLYDESGASLKLFMDLKNILEYIYLGFYLCILEKEQARGVGEEQRERETENLKLSMKPTPGLDLMTLKS